MFDLKEWLTPDQGEILAMYDNRTLTTMKITYMPKSHKDDYVEPFIVKPAEDLDEGGPPHAMEIAPEPIWIDDKGCKQWLNKEVDMSDPLKWELMDLEFPQDTWVPHRKPSIDVDAKRENNPDNEDAPVYIAMPKPTHEGQVFLN